MQGVPDEPDLVWLGERVEGAGQLVDGPAGQEVWQDVLLQLVELALQLEAQVEQGQVQEIRPGSGTNKAS